MKRLSLAIACLLIGFGAGWFMRGEPLTTNLAATPSEVLGEGGIISPPSTAGRTPEQAAPLASRKNIKDFIQSLSGESPENQETTQLEVDQGVASRFERLLKAGDYSEAMDWYQEYIDSVSVLKSILLNYLDELLRSRRDQDFIQLSDQYLYTYYDDIDVLLRLARHHQINGFYTEAVDVYQLAQTYAYSDQHLQRLYDSFNEFVLEVDSLYRQNENWYSLTNFYHHIESLGMLSPVFEYRQALAYLQSGDEPMAIQKLEQLQGDGSVGEKARQLLASLAPDNESQSSPSEQSMTAVKLQKRGNQFLVNASLNGNDKTTLLIDTGASLTTLSASNFATMSSRRSAVKVGTRLFQTANGVTRGNVYRVAEFQLGPYVLSDVQIAVLDFSLSQGIDGLLGMNVLGQFRFQIDQDESLLYLSEKTP